MNDTVLLALAAQIRQRLGAAADCSLHRAIDAANAAGRITLPEVRQLRFLATLAPKASRGEASSKALAEAIYAGRAWLAYDRSERSGLDGAGTDSCGTTTPPSSSDPVDKVACAAEAKGFGAALAGLCAVGAALTVVVAVVAK